jgi:hypothetical protein
MALPAGVPPGPRETEEDTMRIKTWHVELFLDEDGDRTIARAVLHTGLSSHVEGRGTTCRAPDDTDVPEIGDEVAAARALHALADELLRTAAGDIAALEHAPVRLGFDDPPTSAPERLAPPRTHRPRQPRRPTVPS